jgi:SARP family transcriptional regulator, regulator of embCAB operon
MAEIWGEDLPQQATLGLQVYVSRLRKLLARPGRPSPIHTEPSGYTLRLGDDELDVRIFLTLIEQGREHARENRCESAASCFERALALWRGPILAENRRGPILGGFVSWTAETRTECIEMLLDAQLRLGRHHELIGRLYALTTEYPHSETYYRLLMLALFRSDRRADALKVYESARRRLNEELGLEPGRALRDTQRAILLGVDHRHEANAAS